MMDVLISLGTLFFFIILGMIFARFDLVPKKVDKFLFISLGALLFFMGVRVGRIENIQEQLVHIGLLSFGFAVATTLGTGVILLFFSKNRKSKMSNMQEQTPEASKKSDDALSLDKKSLSKDRTQRLNFLEPLKLISLVVTGFCAGFFVPFLFQWFSDNLTTYLLYLLLFIIGAQLVRNKVDVKTMITSKSTLILPLGTIIGSLSGGFLAALFFSLSPGKGLALASGFGWYSLSGVLITDMGDPVLGSAGFLINLMREAMALMIIPFLRNFPFAAIGIGGATSMDVTLPLVEQSCGTEYVPLSIAHGALLSLLVPFLVPLFFQMSF